MIQQNSINYTNDNIESISNFFSEDFTFQKIIVPQKYPNVEDILDIYIYPEIINSKLIETKIGLSNEGQKLTGYKLVAQVKIKHKITYTANETYQSICAFNYETFQNIHISLPQIIEDKNIYDLFKSSRITVNPFNEHINVTKIDSRSFNISTLILLDAQIRL